MIYNQITSVMDTIEQMVRNEDKHDLIMNFLNISYPEIKKNLLINDIKSCSNCSLYPCNHVPCEGTINTDIMMIGEAPGEQETIQGRPFIGPAGQILEAMLTSAAEKINGRWHRDGIFLTNTVKCHPTENGKNRAPNDKEIAACRPFLTKEIEIVKPKIIICVGNVAANTLIHPNFKVGEEHGKIFSYNNDTKLMAIYHPSYVLHKGPTTAEGKQAKIDMWNDLKIANDYLDSLTK